MMDRCRFLLTSLAGALAAPLAAEAQQLPKVPRIGVLGAQSLGPGPDDAFRDGLRQFGYVEGRTSPLNGEGRRRDPTGSPSSPPTWCGSRLKSSSQRTTQR